MHSFKKVLLNTAKTPHRHINKWSVTLYFSFFIYSYCYYFFYYYFKYSFHKRLGLRLATNYSWCLLNNHFISQKPTLKSSLVDFKQRLEGRVSSQSLVDIHAIKSEAIHSFVPCSAFCYLVIPYAILQDFVWLLTTSMPTALMAYARIANDCSRQLCK